MRQQYRTAAIDAANKFFEEPSENTATDYEKAQLALQAYRERLKAERLAREAERQARRDWAQ
ncbi:hypothetical protein [Bradyrhizobium sp. WSM2793]|uniref:hypothetical protein n=1 Tax=Bradyrhizobium sp. WSM2793 TaxID=1038866 RepID=UPI00035CB42A|nr:hypothetical protein [Bradyrhizobium sp. WSM2793]